MNENVRKVCVVFFACLLMTPLTTVGQVSRESLLIEYRYETSGGVSVFDGAVATGQIDDTGIFGTNHAIGSSGESFIGLTYETDTPADIGSSFSLNFPSPESIANQVSIAMTAGDALSSITLEDFRVEAWFKTTDTGRSNLVSSYSEPITTALNLELHTGNRGRIYVQGPNATTDLNLTLPEDSRDGEWHHLAGLRTGNIVELYFDTENWLVKPSTEQAASRSTNGNSFWAWMDDQTTLRDFRAAWTTFGFTTVPILRR